MISRHVHADRTDENFGYTFTAFLFHIYVLISEYFPNHTT